MPGAGIRRLLGVPRVSILVAGVVLVAGCAGESTAPDDLPSPRTVTTTITLPPEEPDTEEPAVAPSASTESRYPPADGSLESLRHPDWVYGDVVSVTETTLVLSEFYELADYGPDDPRTQISRAYAMKHDDVMWPPFNEVNMIDLDRNVTFDISDTTCLLIDPEDPTDPEHHVTPCSTIARVFNSDDYVGSGGRSEYLSFRVSRQGGATPDRLQSLFYS